MNMNEIEYQLLFANNSFDSKIRYKLIRETKMYVFLQEISKEPTYIYRVHKNTLNVKGIKEGIDGYTWDVQRAVSLKKL